MLQDQGQESLFLLQETKHLNKTENKKHKTENWCLECHECILICTNEDAVYGYVCIMSHGAMMMKFNIDKIKKWTNKQPEKIMPK